MSPVNALREIVKLDLEKTVEGRTDFHSGPNAFFKAHAIARDAVKEWDEKKKRAEEKTKPPSDEFMDAFASAGSLVTECDWCERIHFCTGGLGDYEEGELEELRANAGKNSDKYIEHGDCDSISHGYLAGRRYVYSCPCNAVRGYEDFIWNERRRIMDYLRIRFVKIREQVESDLRAADILRDLNIQNFDNEAYKTLQEWLKSGKDRREGSPR